jgi:lactoylglutathione lyase
MKFVQKLIEIMVKVQLNLVVIRSTNLEKAVKFYQMLGLSFDKHQHESGSEHFASKIEQVTFEIYPQTAKTEPTTGTRLGFQVSDIDSLIITLQKEDVPFLTKLSESEWGRRAVVVDPDGHRVEVTQL